jgi:flavodoxin
MVCKEFREEMSKVIRRKQVVGYFPKLNGTDFYYIITPDIKINKPYYKAKMEVMMDVCRNMKVKYPDSVFSFTDRLSQPGAKYYGLPENYKEQKPPKTEKLEDIVVKFLEKELSNVTANQYQIGYEVKNVKDHYYIIGSRDYLKGKELENIRDVIDKAKSHFEDFNFVFDWLQYKGSLSDVIGSGTTSKIKILDIYPF